MGDYQVLFSGEVVREADAEAVRARLADELGIDDRKARQLFSGRTVVIKSQLSQNEAEEVQARLEELGARCRVKNLAVPATAFQRPQPRQRCAAPGGKQDHTLKDITAAHIECPRCGHLQLESSHCVTCGVDIVAAVAQKRKEDLLIEKKIRRPPRLKQGGPQGARQGWPLTTLAAQPKHLRPPVADGRSRADVAGSRVLDAKRSGLHSQPVQENLLIFAPIRRR